MLNEQVCIRKGALPLPLPTQHMLPALTRSHNLIYLLLGQPKAWGCVSPPQLEKAYEMPREGPQLRPRSFSLVTSHRASTRVEGRLTCGKPHFLVALGKFNIKIGDQGVDIVVALYLQAEGRRE